MFGDILVTAWNWPRWQCLPHGNCQCYKPGCFPLGELAVKTFTSIPLPGQFWCTWQGGERGLWKERQDPGGHTDRDRDNSQASQIANFWENTNCSGEGSLRPLSNFKGIPCPIPDPSLLLLVWEVLSDDFHGKIMASKNQSIAIPIPKVRPNATKLEYPIAYSYRSFFLPLYIDQNLKKYFTLQLEIGNIQHLRMTQWAVVANIT